MSEINVTPFVDVMLVLLIIFMVAAPLLTVGVEINLPNTEAKALPSEKEQPLTLSMTSEGKLILQETEISRKELVSKLKAISVERNDDRIFFRADGINDYDSVMKIMGALSGAGFPNISLVTDTN
tara:strand:+ start:141 stop:515 length:375 start_codon:yes stop_codon:yes gene_type:complete